MFRASRRGPGFLGVRGSEAVVTPSPGASLASDCEGLGVELRVYLPPGGEAECSCLPAEGDIIGHACRETVLCVAGGDDVQVCHEIRGPMGLVGTQVVRVCSEAPNPTDKGGDLLFFGFF